MLSVDEILQVYKQVYKSHWYFKKKFILPAMQRGWIEMQYPDKPNHPQQKYKLTERKGCYCLILLFNKTNKNK